MRVSNERVCFVHDTSHFSKCTLQTDERKYTFKDVAQWLKDKEVDVLVDAMP